jgi:hypothetical protein
MSKRAGDERFAFSRLWYLIERISALSNRIPMLRIARVE